MSATLPTVGELIENNPGLDVAGYGTSLLLKAPPTARFREIEAHYKRKNAQPHYRLKGRHFSMLGDIWTLAEFLSHSSPKVQDRARAILMEVASRAQALAEAGTDLEDMKSDLLIRAKEVMP